MDTSTFVPAAADLDRSLEGATPGDVVLLVQQSVRLGALDTAIALCEAAERRGLSDPSLVISEAMARFGAGQREPALALVERVLAGSPEHLVARDMKGHMLLALGRTPESRALFAAVVDRFPEYPGALAALSRILLPGPPYRDVLARVHRALRPETYLEIGVETGATLALAVTARIAVGVDPATSPPSEPLPASARLHRTTSDDFFARESVATAFDGAPVDLAFIDGMHWFEYALRDFANAERWARPNGTILLHDCLPVAKVAALRERASTFWVGDVWKVLEILIEHRPDLRVTVIPTPPSGLVVVKGLDPSSTTLFDRMQAIVEDYRDRPYPHSPGQWPARYSIVENDAAGVAAALA
jgi:hypothetical protein